MVSPTRRALVTELANHDRLVEIGIGDRPDTAQALAERGCHVTAIDVEPGDQTLAAARDTRDEAVDGSLRVRRGDVLALAEGGTERDAGPLANADDTIAIDAVYACRLPAELQRPTVAFAERLGAVCVFTTLGFEEPVVPVSRRSIGGVSLYVARDGARGPRSSGPE